MLPEVRNSSDAGWGNRRNLFPGSNYSIGILTAPGMESYLFVGEFSGNLRLLLTEESIYGQVLKEKLLLQPRKYIRLD